MSIRTTADPADLGFKQGIEAELQRLAALPANWDRYGAPPIDRAIIAAAVGFVRALPTELVGSPGVVPMSPGNLQLEWHRGKKVLEFEFETPHTIRSLQWDPEAGIAEEEVFPADEVDRAVELLRWSL